MRSISMAYPTIDLAATGAHIRQLRLEQGYYTHFAPPRQENLPHCTGLLWPVQCFFVAKYLLCEETKS